jgi:hypothetical protein
MLADLVAIPEFSSDEITHAAVPPTRLILTIPRGCSTAHGDFDRRRL